MPPSASSSTTLAPTPAPNTLPKAKSEPLPPWVPISLLALTTAALAVPLVLIKRHRANALTSTLAAPPRRTASVGGFVPAPPPPPRVVSAPSAPAASAPVDEFNGAVYGAKAFGYATLFVTVGALGVGWGVKSAMGVRDTQEFAQRMREIVRTKMPVFSERLHRALAEEEVEPSDTLGEASEEWAWPDAERRLSAAYETGGFSGWARVALQELEAEGRAERQRRGHQ